MSISSAASEVYKGLVVVVFSHPFPFLQFLTCLLDRFGLILCEKRSADRCASDGDDEGSVRQRFDP